MHSSSFYASISTILWSLFVVPILSQSNSSNFQTFITEPQFNPPVFAVNKSGAELAAGLLMFTPIQVTNQDSAPMIMTDSGDLVWNGPAAASTNLLVQALDGQPVISYWSGLPIKIGIGYGNITIVDDQYNVLYTICPDFPVLTTNGTMTGCTLDLHESSITDRGTILVTVMNVTNADLTPVGGPKDGWVFESLFLEVDIKTQKIVFQWSPLAAGIPINTTNFPLLTTGKSPSDPFDWFHLNSVQAVGDGYLVNSRHTWSTYAVNSRGGVDWVIQGSKGGDFKLGEGVSFQWQHHALIQEMRDNALVISYFNNNNGIVLDPLTPSNGLLILLDLSAFTATLINSYTDPTDAVDSTSQGSFSILCNDNIFLGYGNIPKIKEFGPHGDIRMTILFGEGIGASYRAFKQIWEATPAGWDPVVVANSSGHGWVSWNGDTRTTEWVVYAGKNNNDLDEVARVDRDSFETEFNFPTSASYVQVGAFDHGHFLRKSNVVKISS